jgi:SAM-dependent methyltransferase
MNLYDVVKRRDRLAAFDADAVLAVEASVFGGKDRCVTLAPGATLRVLRANEVNALRCFPHSPGWTLLPPPRGESAIEVSIAPTARPGAPQSLARVAAGPATGPVRVLLRWPAVAGADAGFDLVLRNPAREPACVSVGPLFTARDLLLTELRGSGVEVGPGTNPQVRPGRNIDVKYVESMPGKEWARVYAKKSGPSPQMKELWEQYVVASAHSLDVFDDASLDFVFSNHVFEHLVNPLGVLRNWHRKLRDGGIVAGVIPDARFTFDLRQPLSTIDECIAELQRDDYQLTDSHYERWCRYTAPYNRPEDLIARRYSIHAKYYSAESFREVLEWSADVVGWSDVFVHATQNGKDFGFLVRKPAGVFARTPASLTGSGKHSNA